MSGSPPTTLGKYQIIREIARSNDIVYEAYDPLMNRRVALKELAMPGGASAPQKEDRIKRFLREARAAGSLAHPNIMTVYEVGQEGDRYFIAMEYLDGKTLRNELDTKGFLPPERATEIAKSVLEALEYAHTKGVIHRDIKPDNIQLLSNGVIKLTDFGIARLTFEPNLTIDGQVFGTPSYMSPEQVVGRDIDARSDLFSVGVVLYEMLSGTKPFPGDTVVTITYSIMNRTPDRPQQVNWALWQVVEKALDKSPQLRFRGSREFIEGIDEAMAASSGAVIDPRGATLNQPPPQVNPYMQQPYGQQQMYGQSPYGQGSIYSPGSYAVPQQQQQIQQIQQGQNPYANMPAQQPPYIPGMINPSNQSTPPAYGYQVPVYYPPPPRKPLVIISAQTKRLIANAILYTLGFVVLLFALLKGVDVFTNIGSSSPNNSAPASASAAKPGAVAQPKTDPVSVLLRQGASAEKNHDYDTAEGAYKKAMDLDPKNPESYASLADLFITKANEELDNSHREDFLSHAAEYYERGAGVSGSSAERDDLSLRAAQSLYQLALMLQQDGNVRDARQALYNALADAHSDPQQTTLIKGLLNRLSSSQ